ncbi:MAG: hypothetical protein HY231_08860 [Acidobacteria bacterium]|nr:hypothetical protein [Acidobacteriota bacterium]
MDKISTLDLSNDQDKEIQDAINKCVTEVQNILEQMANGQTEIDRLKAETRAMLAELIAA